MSWLEDLDREVEEMAEELISKGSVESALATARSIEADCSDDDEGIIKSLFFGMVADAIQTRLLN